MMKDIRVLIENGENSFVEFKEDMVSSVEFSEEITAFLNVKGGVVLIGVSDKCEVKGVENAKLKKIEEWVMNVCRNNILPPVIPLYETIKIDNKIIAKISIPEGIEKPYQTLQGKYLIRVGSTKRLSSREELLRLFQNAYICHIDDRPIIGSSINDIKIDKVALYFKNNYEIDWEDMSDEEVKNLMVNSCILSEYDNKEFATIPGLVFFSKNNGIPINSLERYLPNAGVKFVAYKDEEMGEILDKYFCFESCPELIDIIVQKIKINWKASSIIEGLKRIETAFPVKIFRELIVNAIVHRDYSIRANIQVNMFPFKIKIVSPGNLVNTVTIEKMKAGISISRNPIVLKFMENFRYADHLGRGIPIIIREVNKMPGFSIEFEERDDQFHATLTWSKLD